MSSSLPELVETPVSNLTPPWQLSRAVENAVNRHPELAIRAYQEMETILEYMEYCKDKELFYIGKSLNPNVMDIVLPELIETGLVYNSVVVSGKPEMNCTVLMMNREWAISKRETKDLLKGGYNTRYVLFRSPRD